MFIIYFYAAREKPTTLPTDRTKLSTPSVQCGKVPTSEQAEHDRHLARTMPARLSFPSAEALGTPSRQAHTMPAWNNHFPSRHPNFLEPAYPRMSPRHMNPKLSELGLKQVASSGSLLNQAFNNQEMVAGNIPANSVGYLGSGNLGYPIDSPNAPTFSMSSPDTIRRKKGDPTKSGSGVLNTVKVGFE